MLGGGGGREGGGEGGGEGGVLNNFQFGIFLVLVFLE